MNVNERTMPVTLAVALRAGDSEPPPRRTALATFRVKQLKLNARPLPKAAAPRVNPGCIEAFGRWAKGARDFLLEGEFH
jgi:hypothetical protein